MPEYSFILSTKLLRRITKACAVLLNETRIALNDEGIAIRAVDPGNVCLVDISLKKEEFEAYEVKNSVIGVDVQRLHSFSKTIRDKLAIIEGDERTLKLKASKISYSLSLIDPSVIKKEPKLPVLDLPAVTEVTGNEFRNAITMADKITDSIAFEANDSFHMVAEGNTDNVMVDLSENYEGDAEERTVIGVELLKEVAKAIEKDDIVKLEVGTNKPLRISIEERTGIHFESYT
jgi:proliferating cell nuclear antigen